MHKTVEITCFTKMFYVTAFRFVGCILLNTNTLTALGEQPNPKHPVFKRFKQPRQACKTIQRWNSPFTAHKWRTCVRNYESHEVSKSTQPVWYPLEILAFPYATVGRPPVDSQEPSWLPWPVSPSPWHLLPQGPSSPGVCWLSSCRAGAPVLLMLVPRYHHDIWVCTARWLNKNMLENSVICFA